MNPYGFDWGPAAITRVCHIEGRGRVLSIKTDHAEMQIHITEKGRGITAYPMTNANVNFRRHDAIVSSQEGES